LSDKNVANAPVEIVLDLRLIGALKSFLRRAIPSDLEAQSVVAGWVLPPTQSVLTRLGVGNEKATIGRDSWLACRPDLDYVTGHGFLEAGQAHPRKDAEQENSARSSDPVAASRNATS